MVNVRNLSVFLVLLIFSTVYECDQCRDSLFTNITCINFFSCKLSIHRFKVYSSQYVSLLPNIFLNRIISFVHIVYRLSGREGLVVLTTPVVK